MLDIDPKQRGLLDHFGADLEPGLRRRVGNVRKQATSLLADYGRPNVHLLPHDPAMPVDLGSPRTYVRNNFQDGICQIVIFAFLLISGDMEWDGMNISWIYILG